MEGTPFGRYRLIELLGRGGMGEVWRALDTETNNRTVAIKLLPPHLAADKSFAQRFRREADAAARLNNPHIIPIHTYGEIDGRLYVDMRLIEGRDLQEVLADGPLEPARAVRIIEQVARALQAAHKVGLVHRDVKPSNILLDEDDFAYLIDFGIARGTDETSMTGTGNIIGSWAYMAPERLRAGEVDARADIYALACVLYECLTGGPPFPGDTLEQQVTAHLTAQPPRPSITDPRVPVALDAVIATGMAKAPEQRYATTVQLAHAAHDAITTPIPAATPTMQPGPLTRQAPGRSAVSSAPGEMPPPRSGAAHDSAPRPSWRRNQVMIPIAVVLAVVVGAAVVLVVTVNSNRGPTESAPAAQLSTTPTTTTTSNTAASACTDFKFNGGFALDQSNRYRVDFTSTGQAASGRATATNGSNTLAGNVSGGVTGSHVDFTIQWDSGPRGRYTGEIDPDGFARGTNFDEANPGTTGTWNSTTPFTCAKPR